MSLMGLQEHLFLYRAQGEFNASIKLTDIALFDVSFLCIVELIIV
jgi:hypothetical protein